MKIRLILSAIVMTIGIHDAQAQVPYYKVRYEEGKECRYFYSGHMIKGMENLVSVQCF